MSANLTTTATKPTLPLVAPLDGELWNYNSIIVALVQALLNYCGWLDARVAADVSNPGATTTIDISRSTWELHEPTVDCVATLRQSTAPIPYAGVRIRCTTQGAYVTKKVDFKRESGATIATFPAGGTISWAEFEYSFVGDWRVTAWGGGTTNVIT